MIDWVHSLANDWGHYVRKAEAKNGQLQGTLGRIREEGLDGASIRAHASNIPVMDFPEEIASFHRAWLGLDRQYRMVFWVDYAMRLGTQRKFEALNKKKNAYYRLRDRAHSMISYEMAVK